MDSFTPRSRGCLSWSRHGAGSGAILATKPHPEMGDRSCLGILRLAKTYSAPRLEAASQRALQLQAFSYQSLRSILKNSLDHQVLSAPEEHPSGPVHENVRGAGYYDVPNSVLQSIVHP